MINYTAATLLAFGIVFHSLGERHSLLGAIGIIFAMAFFLLVYLQYPVMFLGNARYPLARRCFPLVRWAIFAIYLTDLSTTLMAPWGGPGWQVSIHAYSLWAGLYLVVYSLASLTGPPRQRRRRHIQRSGPRWGPLVPVPLPA